MKSTLLWASLFALTLAACPGALADPQQYGAKLSDATAVRIAELTRNPAEYVDRRVRVEGLVDDVCPMKGCWVDIIDAQSEETVRFKVQDDVIVFPVAAQGEKIVAEGVVRRHELDHDAAIKYLRHLAEEKGEPFDDASVSGPMTLYRIEGDAAVVGD